jgi:hypothetical protein
MSQEIQNLYLRFFVLLFFLSFNQEAVYEIWNPTASDW